MKIVYAANMMQFMSGVDIGVLKKEPLRHLTHIEIGEVLFTQVQLKEGYN